MGTAVLVSDHVGLSDYVSEKKLGWVCQLHVDSIKKNLESIFSMRNERTEIRNAAPAIIENDFNKEKLAEQYAAAYSDFMNAPVKVLQNV